MSKILTNNTDLQEVLQTLQHKATGGSTEQATPVIAVNSSTGLITATAGVKSATEQLATQEAKVITPSKSSQTAVAKGVYTTGVVTVDAIPEQYQDVSEVTATASDVLSGKKIVNSSGSVVTGIIAAKTSSDLTVNGATVNVPNGYYANGASKSVETATQATPSISVDPMGLITAIATQTSGYVASGTKAATKQLAFQDAKTITPGITDQIAVSSGYYTGGNITVKGDNNLVAGNIKNGVSIFGVSGTLEQGSDPVLQNKTVTPTKSQQSVAADSGYDGLNTVTVNAIPSEYVTTTDATASAGDLLSGKTAYVNGNKITGTISTKTSSDLTASGATVTVPSGYYASSASKSIATATQATPSITVDANGLIIASATQSAGYVASGSKSSTKQLSTQNTKKITPTTTEQTAVSSGVYTTGAVTVAGDANLISGNIRSGVSIFGVNGSLEIGEQATPTISVNSSGLVTATAGDKTATKQLAFQASKTITPGTADQIAVSSGYYTGGNITVKGDGNLVAGNIKEGVSIFGVAGTLTEGSSGSGEASEWSANEDALVTRTLINYTNDRVESIGPYAFTNSPIETVDFPKVKTIGSFAFNSCSSLTNASFPAVTSIGASAFCGCESLTAVDFSKVATIPISAFAGCSAIATASFPAATTIGVGAFARCNSLTTASYSMVKIIPNSAFCLCYALTAADFPVATRVDQSAFYQCGSLSEVNMSPVQEIGRAAFASCVSLRKINFPNANRIDPYAFNYCQFWGIDFPVVKTIGSSAFYQCDNLISASFPAATTIGESAFYYCYSLRKLFLPGSTVCTLTNSNAFSYTPYTNHTLPAPRIYVPKSLITSYQTATNWVYYSSYFGSFEEEAFVYFTINGVSYSAEKNATWQEWTGSTSAYHVEQDYVVDGSGMAITAQNNVQVWPDEVIIGDVNYTLMTVDSSEQREIPSTITFSIGITQYQAEPGMTWSEWVGSEYNTHGYEAEPERDRICCQHENQESVGDFKYISVSLNDVIIKNGMYKTIFGGGTNTASRSVGHFYIDETLYHCTLSGRVGEMPTWQEWIESSYNVDGFVVSNGCIIHSATGRVVVDINDSFVLPSDKVAYSKTIAVEPQTITFNIGITQYEAEEGMTWAEWVESEYNTFDNGIYGVYAGIIRCSDHPQHHIANSAGVDVLPSDAIAANGQYKIVEGSAMGNESMFYNYFFIGDTYYHHYADFMSEACTWAEWVNSEYNTDGYSIDSRDNRITIALPDDNGADRTYVVDREDGSDVYASDTIIDETRYILSNLGEGDEPL